MSSLISDEMGLFFIADDYYGQPNKGQLTSTTA